MYRRDGLISLIPPTILNEKYRIVRTAGFDKNGITYLAVDEVSGVNYIVFEFAPAGILERCADGRLAAVRDLEEKYDDLKRQFMAEVITAASVVEPEITEGIVRVIDYFEGNNTGYVVMDMLTDMTLGEWARNRSASSNEAELIIALNSAARSIAELNKRGYFPTTIQPDSFLKEGQIYRFLCWGNIGILFSAESKHYDTEGFTAPEDRGISCEGSSQGCVYSLAAVLYYCLSGLCQPVPVTKSTNHTGKTSDSVTKLVINKALRLLPTRRYVSIPHFWFNLRTAIFQGQAEDYDDGADDTAQIKTVKLTNETSYDEIGNATDQDWQTDVTESEMSEVYDDGWLEDSQGESGDVGGRHSGEEPGEGPGKKPGEKDPNKKWRILAVAGGSILLFLLILIIVWRLLGKETDDPTSNVTESHTQSYDSAEDSIEGSIENSIEDSTDETGENISGTFYIVSMENEAVCLQTTETAINGSTLILAETDTDYPVSNALFDIMMVTSEEKSGYVFRCHSDQSDNWLTGEDYVLSVMDQSRENGAVLCQREYRIVEDQFWNIIETGDGCFYIENIYGTCIDASDFESAGVCLREYEGSPSQKWKLVKMPEE